MKKFKLYIILIAIFLLILFLAIIAFYSIPYTKCNSLILSANKNETGLHAIHLLKKDLKSLMEKSLLNLFSRN